MSLIKSAQRSAVLYVRLIYFHKAQHRHCPVPDLKSFRGAVGEIAPAAHICAPTYFIHLLELFCSEG